MKYKFLVIVVIISFGTLSSYAQTADELVKKVKAKLDKVTDYEASGKLKTNVTFLKVPVATIKLYYKKPNKMKIKSEKGLSFVPKGAVNINMGNTIGSGKYTAIDAGTVKLNGSDVKLITLLPEDNADVVLSKLYIDPINFVIKKAITTTKDNGTYELEMTYGKYIEYGLPDKVVFSFNTKDYKLPKGVTFDFDDGTEKKKTESDKEKAKKGKAEISFSSYIVNKGVTEEIFNK